MFYATRTQQVTATSAEKQLLSFYTKTQRDEYCNFEDGTAIAAREANKLQPAGTRRGVKSPEAGVFFVQAVL